MKTPILSVSDVEVIFDRAILALHGVSLEVPAGSIVALLGANGAGKTTTLLAISRLLVLEFGEITRGQIRYDGEDVTAADPADLVAAGLVQVLEGRHCFPHLSVEENLIMGAAGRNLSRRELREKLERSYAAFPRLHERRTSRAGYTSGGEQQMLAIGRALMSRPRLLLLDEPSLGLAPLLVHQIFSAIRELNGRDKLTVFLVEQNAFHALKLAHRGYVMINGQITLSGAGRELLKRPEIRAAYLEGSRIEQAQGKK